MSNHPLNQHLVLIGPMGAGKTTIGKMLANELQLPFFDCDEQIEQRAGVDISWIFDIEGEASFRKRETAMLTTLLQGSCSVISTGGGVVTQENNRRLLAAMHQVIYLKPTKKQVLSRLHGDTKRPLLQHDDPGAIISDLMDTREPWYQQVADDIISTDGLNAQQVVDHILAQWRQP